MLQLIKHYSFKHFSPWILEDGKMLDVGWNDASFFPDPIHSSLILTRLHPPRKCLMEHCPSRLHTINLRQDRGIAKPGRNYIMLRNLLWHRVGTLWHHFVCVQQFQHPMIFLFHTSGHEMKRILHYCLTSRQLTPKKVHFRALTQAANYAISIINSFFKDRRSFTLKKI